jgi:hypothetical protein
MHNASFEPFPVYVDVRAVGSKRRLRSFSSGQEVSRHLAGCANGEIVSHRSLFSHSNEDEAEDIDEAQQGWHRLFPSLSISLAVSSAARAFSAWTELFLDVLR